MPTEKLNGQNGEIGISPVREKNKIEDGRPVVNADVSPNDRGEGVTQTAYRYGLKGLSFSGENDDPFLFSKNSYLMLDIIPMCAIIVKMKYTYSGTE